MLGWLKILKIYSKTRHSIPVTVEVQCQQLVNIPVVKLSEVPTKEDCFGCMTSGVLQKRLQTSYFHVYNQPAFKFLNSQKERDGHAKWTSFYSFTCAELTPVI